MNELEKRVIEYYKNESKKSSQICKKFKIRISVADRIILKYGSYEK